MKTVMLVGFFVNRDEAQAAFHGLRRRGYLRAALVEKNDENHIQIQDPFIWHRMFGVGAGMVVGALLGFVLALQSEWVLPIFSGASPTLGPLLAGALAGALLSHLWFQRARYGIERSLLQVYARRLVTGETALLLKGPIERVRSAVNELMETSEITPAVFILHPHLQSTRCHSEELSPSGTPLSPAQLQEYARRMAAEHLLDPRPLRSNALLKELDRERRWVQQVCVSLAEAAPLQQSLPPTAEWLLDNEYILESNARDVQLNLPWSFYRQLPALVSEPDRGRPRIYGLARALAANTGLLLEEQNILAFIEAYQTAKPLSIGELWAVPQMLRMVLIENIGQLASETLCELREQEIADIWANRLITANRRDPNQLFTIMADLTATHPAPSAYFASQLIDYLYDEGAALAPVQAWLERYFHKSISELMVSVRTRQTRDQIAIGNAFTSLRQLALLDWKLSFEQLSRVDQILRQDPAGIYPQMDFTTRNQYRRAIEDLRRGSRLAEEQVAQCVLELAAAVHADAEGDERAAHVGTYLVGAQRTRLARQIGCREALQFRLLHWAFCHHTRVYFTGLAGLSATLMGLLLGLNPYQASLPTQLGIAALLIIPISQLALEILNMLIMRAFSPRALPKMDFSDTGIPASCRTLVVVPMMLVNVHTIEDEAEKLEIRYLANKEANLLFGLYADYRDAASVQLEGDAELLQTAIRCTEALNERHGAGRFFLFHRERKWCQSEQAFMGWERKRGKLEELNELIVGTRARDADPLVRVGEAQALTDVRYVITLDSDTQLPADAARRLIETLAHPLNRAHLNDSGQVVSGYTIIQPRVSPSLPSTSGSPFSRLFADAVGIDPYAHTVSDVYQDLTGEGSYHGKGIYDVRVFNQILAGRFPEDWLLSHDLIEGAHVHVGFASDIELYDEFPQDYLSYSKRQHRWTRGDWQIMDWIMPRVPQANGARARNPLSGMNRWKIFDNLRRSLLPAASTVLLITAWMSSPRAGWIASMVVAAQLLFHSLIQPVTWATTRGALREVTLAKLWHDLVRIVVEAALLPYQAWQSLDAIVRVVYRRNISHRGLLEWASAQAVQQRTQSRESRLLISLGLSSVLSVALGWAIVARQPANLLVASPWLLVWFISPLIGWLLCRRPPVMPPQTLLNDEERQFLRGVARRTWRYFEDFVTAETNWLPPDNFQVSYQNGLALRTSPTNIGLHLVSILSAHEFGYVSPDQVERDLARSLETIQGLERHEGHLLNWYDVQTRAPLRPLYVSTVDSGNLLGSLWTLSRGLEAMMQRPLLDARVLIGLHDVGSLLRQASAAAPQQRGDHGELDDLMRTWRTPPVGALELLRALRRAESVTSHWPAQALSVVIEPSLPVYWAGQLHSQLQAWLGTADHYLGWIEILAEQANDALAELDIQTRQAIAAVQHQAPSLQQVAGGNPSGIAALWDAAPGAAQPGPALQQWIDRVRVAFEGAQHRAQATLAALERLVRTCVELADSMSMRFLYNADRRLFSIGFNVSEGRLDRSFYDLLASEARLGSFIAIARGEIPAEHWFAMSRPYGAIGGRRALLSWTGTMFEYLMPLLFQHSMGNALLDKAAREAVAIQIAYGRQHRVPWGISECAFGDLDARRTYQYRAFGVPQLGLKRGLADKIVVAPYATLLAVALAPREAVHNLKQLAELGLLQDYGFYEALDFSRQSRHSKATGVLVRAYMAHHHGMSLLALTNFLHDDCLRRYFHADPRIRTVEPLLLERIPKRPPLHHVSTRERVISIASVGEITPSVSQFDTPHTTTPKTQLLSNGRYALMLTNAGGGYSRWGDFDLTRWRSDPTGDAWGTFCYLRDVDSGSLWCNSYQPIGRRVDQFCVNFTLDRAVFRRVDQDIECETEIIVAPEDDVEIRRLSLINRSNRVRRIELTSYMELALAPHNADRQHPAFNKLFMQTEALPEHRAVLASRRLRSDGETPIHVAHRITLEREVQPAADEPLRFETDRKRFIGRGRTLANPDGATQEPECSQGFVLDPILSLRQAITLEPGQRMPVSLILAAGSTREHVTMLMEKYGDPHAIKRAMDFAWASAQLELRLLRIQPDEARRFQQLASHLLYPNALLRAATQRIAANRKGQSGLWAYAISGDLPIVLVTIGESRDLALVRQVLQAHHYWRMHGLMSDLVILNEENGGYAQPLREELERLIQLHGVSSAIDRPGGIFLRSADLIPADDLTLLRAVASVALVAARGTLPQQLAAPAPVATAIPVPLPRKRDPRDLSASLPFMELPFFNGLGGFTQDGREYAIYLGPGLHTPTPWVNVIANPTFGTLVSETGAGFTWQGNSQRNRLTQWSNDPVIDPPAEAIYIRDEETGIHWTPTASPIREETAYRARHGAGYSVFEHNSRGIEQVLTVFVPVDEQGGEPIKLQRLMLRNDSGRPRRLSLTYYVEWTLGENRESTQMHVVTTWDDEAKALLARNHYHPDSPHGIAFAAVSATAISYTGSRLEFVGRNRDLGNPAAMEQIHLSRRTGAGLDPCAAIRVAVRLAPGESAEITCMLGEATSLEQVHALVLAYRSRQTVQNALQQTQGWWEAQLSGIQVHTPELSADLLLNRWLLYQSLGSRIWGRTGFYQSGGAFGFRDQLQDVMALLYARPQLAREQIVLAASRQFKEGDVQHWWHPPDGAGIRSRISDDRLWLPYVAAQYVRVTGDLGLLREMVTFLESPPLAPDQHELFQLPAEAADRATVFEHCQRALAVSQRFGAHGLPLMGTGDWNDGMNLVGADGQGESVWLGWFMVDVMQGMAELAALLDQPELVQTYQQERQQLVHRIEQFAWDGEWYLRATFDDGSLLGSSQNAEARIDSLPQSWAALCGAADPIRTGLALDAAWQHLVHQDEGLVQLFEPPFEHAVPSPGYIKGYPPGVRENGGQYTHAALWLAMALARRGDGTRAATILRMVNPIEHARGHESVRRYGIEPYVVAADIYRLPGRIGQGGWSWYTGSAAWMYRAWIEDLLGLRIRGATLQIAPVIPGWWDGFQMSYRHGEALYEIQVENPEHHEQGVAFIELDGQRMSDGIVPLDTAPVKHRILARMG